MNIIFTIIIALLSILWGYFSWMYVLANQSHGVATILLLAGMFVFGVLFGKIISSKKSTQENNITDEIDTDYSYSENTTMPEYLSDNQEIKETDISIEEEKKEQAHSFSDFEDVSDKTILNISNNLKKQNKDDLKIVEGIGPKIEELLNTGGIFSYSDLENAEVETIKTILKNAGNRYLMHNPSTWGKQASYARKGIFEELKQYQNHLTKGIEK